MKVRLIIPQCKNWDGDYCKESIEGSLAFNNRIKVLSHAMQEDGIGIVVTSHNFFLFNPTSKIDFEDFVQINLAEGVLSTIPSKCRKPLVLGLDLHPASSISNPYNGINSIVTFLNVENGGYRYVTHVWECWLNQLSCSQNDFQSQRARRLFCLGGKVFGLLSCGDIAPLCHDERKLLLPVDVYLDLSHKSLKIHTPQCRQPPKIIKSGKAKFIFVTQQVNDVKRYHKEQDYKYIFPRNTPQEVKIYRIDNGTIGGVFVDIII